ncbi:hypothetical protein [Enterobacter kobei]|uniref:hypothetical protein n=1 Tax=Enterobacter kobei TaxID=208224 RepID=UPI003D6E2795
MFHLDNNSGVSAMPPVGAVQSSAPRWYTEGGGGTPASYPGADWYNIIQAELLNLLSAYGINPNKSDFNQLQHAIEEAISQNATANSALLTAIAALVTSANKMPYFTGKDKVAMTDLTAFARTLLGRSDAAGVLSVLGLGEAAKLPSPSFITGPGYTLFKSPFMDGAVVRWFSTLSMSVTPPALTNNTSFSVTFPSAFSSNVMAVLSSDCGQITSGGAQDLGTQIDKISLTGLVIFSRWETRPSAIGDFKFIVTGVMNV